MSIQSSLARLRPWAEPDGDNDQLADIRDDVRTLIRALDKANPPWDPRMSMFQPMHRLREWASKSPESAMSVNPTYIAGVQADALHVLNRHDLLHKMREDSQRHIWYQVGSEGNGNLDISWQERAEEMEMEANRLRADAARWQHVRSAHLTELLALYPTCETCDVGLDYAVDCAIVAKEILEP